MNLVMNTLASHNPFMQTQSLKPAPSAQPAPRKLATYAELLAMKEEMKRVIAETDDFLREIDREIDDLKG